MDETSALSELMRASISDLIPKSLLEAARNPEQVEIMPLRQVDDELNLIVVEHNYGGQTEEATWSEWLKAVKDAEEKGAGRRIVYLPPAPPKIDRLHARFSSEIESGRFSLSDRILLTVTLRIHTHGENKLYVKDYDGEKGLGVAKEFYTSTLPRLAKELGIRFIIGENHAGNLLFFTEKLGRYTYWQLKPEFRQGLFPDVVPNSKMGELVTIQFVEPDDVPKYILAEEVK